MWCLKADNFGNQGSFNLTTRSRVFGGSGLQLLFPRIWHAVADHCVSPRYGRCHVYDHTQPRVQQYWRDNCLKMTQAGADGCGADFSSGDHNSVRPLSPFHFPFFFYSSFFCTSCQE